MRNMHSINSDSLCVFSISFSDCARNEKILTNIYTSILSIILFAVHIYNRNHLIMLADSYSFIKKILKTSELF
jgi:hypothetical protein